MKVKDLIAVLSAVEGDLDVVCEDDHPAYGGLFKVESIEVLEFVPVRETRMIMGKWGEPTATLSPIDELSSSHTRKVERTGEPNVSVVLLELQDRFL